MHSSDIDSLFQRAKEGDKDAYWTLYQEFVRRANIIAIGTIKSIPNYNGISDDFCDLIDELFFKTYKEYKPDKGSFSVFINSTLQRRLVGAIKKEIAEMKMYLVNIDYDNFDINCIEQLADPDQKPMPAELAIQNFKQKISSPNKHKTLNERIRDKVLLLQFAGYSNNDICNYLKISYSTLRRLQRKIRADKEINNIKLDLK